MDAVSGRLLFDGARSAAANMAADAALLRGAARRREPVVRFYRWSRPSLSFGISQRIPPMEYNLGVIRRPTGGGAVVHDGTLTFSLITPAGDPEWGLSAEALHRRVAEIQADALRSLGVPARPAEECSPPPSERGAADLCALRLVRDDLLAGGRKIGGAAQRRLKGAFLYQAYLALETPGAETVSALKALNRSFRLDAYGTLRQALGQASEGFASESPTAVEHAAEHAAEHAVAEALAEAFSRASYETSGRVWAESRLSEEEESDAAELLRSAFGRPEWNWGGGSERRRLRLGFESAVV